MSKITDEEWENLYDNFETTDLLSAVNNIDKARGYLCDNDDWEPPEIRTNILRLHQIAMNVFNNGWRDQVDEMFELASGLDFDLSDSIEHLESVQRVISNLLELYPESLAYEN